MTEFRKYFDKLPQYIKAPADCYTLVHSIDLDDESPNGNTEKKSAGCIDSKGGNLGGHLGARVDSADDSNTATDTIREPFSGDLQLILTERDERDSPIVRRKRRKLPEIPKTPSRRWKDEIRHVSLAQEMSDAERHPYASSMSCNANANASSGLKHHNHVPVSSEGNCNTSSSRPIFILKFNNGIPMDDESSPDSEMYPSLDSGHSTIHSDDGKSYSPLIPSINESYSPGSPSTSGVPFTHLDILEATHRGLHKFIPRHHDEIEVEIGDPIYMQKEADDLWCEGVNLRTGMQGIFPAAYVVDVDYNDFDPTVNKVKKERYLINYIGSIETLYHKGNEVLCQAVKKISSHEGYVATHTRPCILEISDQGIRMLDKGKLSAHHVPCHDYFYALKNVSFCGFHPNDHRYFGFVTKHPTLNRFACHVFMSEDSARPVAEAVGRAFQRFYQKFIETAYPIEDIYLE
ncbi:JNK-interacting protein 1 [Orchesella cincta]|uniref:JNK-interacting protein 1 n=1 Tax=Orchesella cincta TaxID=48709 RepID=A0A1D2MSA6_ORCCI|nr:JNK-interacting protein 1 [Orchesella cincta]